MATRKTESRRRLPIRPAGRTSATTAGLRGGMRLDSPHAGPQKAAESRAGTFWSYLANLGSFLVALLLATFLIHQCIPLPKSQGIRAKLGHFARHKDEYDVLFFGSSLIQRGVIPKLFENEMRRRGYRVNCFNLAFPGMSAHETSVYLRTVLEMQPARLRWGFVELKPWQVGDGWKANRFSDRCIFWHDFIETFEVCRSTWLCNQPRMQKLRDCFTHTTLMLANYANLGQAYHELSPILTNKRTKPKWLGRLGRGYPRKGFASYNDPSPQHERNHQAFLRAVTAGEYANWIEALTEDHATPNDLAEVNTHWLRRDVNHFQSFGAELVYIQPAGRATDYQRLEDAGVIPVLFSFANPSRNRALYDPELHWDESHLNERGARVFTRLVADRFADYLDECKTN